MSLLLLKRRSYTWNSQAIFLFIALLVSFFHYGQSCDLTSPCKPRKHCSHGKCTTSQDLYDRRSQTTASLAAVITVCSILMLCFWGLLCFACFKQCKDCGSSSGMSSCASNSTINSVAVDISSIDIPDDFFRNARIPSAEEYSGPPPYLYLFNPKTRPKSERDEANNIVKPDTQTNDLPPKYKTLFFENPPSYHEIVLQAQTTV
ncbi:hypothetical protein AC249_AIPGENE3894 [Exaiptasia diaphana]|nr:hypothetical protein AC249_AIPGENE3894 [Exaiptasia diaphana]